MTAAQLKLVREHRPQNGPTVATMCPECQQNVDIPVQHQILRPEQACELLQISRTTLWELTRAKRIPYFRAGKGLRFRLTDITAWIEAGGAGLGGFE